MTPRFRKATVLACLFAIGPFVQAAVTADEAAALKSTLMPLGGERAGNKDGTIPPWEGGIKPAPLAKNGRVPAVYADDKPLFTITPQNAAQYADKLSDGVKALLQKYPSYRVVVYPTRRSAAATPWVYDNTFRNATRAKLDASGSLGAFPVKAFGGIPFPIPKSGEEAIWNHLMRWSGEGYRAATEQGRVTPDGKLVVVQQALSQLAWPYYRSDWDLERWEAAGSETGLRRVDTVGPPMRAGEMIVGRGRMDDSKSLTYTYLTGQRRVRRLPLSCCDVPNPVSGGIANFDELETFSFGIGRYDWKLVGKKELYIPYNANRFHQSKTVAEALAVPHINPELLRFELHRVWVVEATLKAGERHPAPKARFYLDEDTWIAATGDRWDAQGNLWKVTFTLPIAFPGLPGVVPVGYYVYDMVRGGYFGLAYGTEGVGGNDKAIQMFDRSSVPAERTFTPEAISGEGVR